MNLRIVKKTSDPQNILGTDLTGLRTTNTEARRYQLQMTQLCRQHNGIGLAANQVGLRLNMFLIMPAAKLLPSKAAELCICPSYEPHPESRLYWPEHGEGCLSLERGKMYKVQRHSKIIASWTNVAGHRVQRTISGTAAQVFQHEHDHLRGLTLVETGEAL